MTHGRFDSETDRLHIDGSDFGSNDRRVGRGQALDRIFPGLSIMTDPRIDTGIGRFSGRSGFGSIGRRVVTKRMPLGSGLLGFDFDPAIGCW